MTIQPYKAPIQVFEGQVEAPPLSQAEYELLRDAMPTMRDQLICKCLRGTGLRINELLRLTVSQVYENGPEMGIYVAQEKKRSPKPVFVARPLSPGISVALKAHIKYLALAPEQRVFKVSARQVQRIFATAGQKAIGRRVHPHELRGLYGTWLVDNHIPIEAVAHLLGHADYRTTQKFYYKGNADKILAIQRGIPV